MKAKTKDERAERQSNELWTISAKLKALAFLISEQKGQVSPASDDVYYGIGEILDGLAREIEQISNSESRIRAQR